jgi:hypothetical protein
MVPQNLNGERGNIYMTEAQANQRAGRELNQIGKNSDAAFKEDGNLHDRIRMRDVKQRALSDLSRFRSAYRIERKAGQAVNQTQAAASKYALESQKRVEKAADDLRALLTKRNADTRDVLRNVRDDVVAKFKKANLAGARKSGNPVGVNQDNGDIFHLPNLGQLVQTDVPLTRAQKDIVSIPSKQYDKASWTESEGQGKHLLPIREASSGRSLRPITSPIKRISALTDAARKVAERRVKGSYKKLTEASARNQALEEVKARAQEHLDRTGKVELPQALQHRLFGEQQSLNPTFLSKLSDLGRDAVYALGVPHMKNVGEQQVLGGAGIPGLLHGMQVAHGLRKGDEQALADSKALESFGGTTHSEREEPVFSGIPKVGKYLGAAARKSNEALDRFETGQRVAAFHHYKKKGMSDYDAAAEVNATFGNHGETSELSQVARQGLGAPFAAWHLGIAPSTTARAIIKHPRSVANLVRVNNTISNDITQPESGKDFSLGGPLENTLKLFAFPYGTADYLSSASTLGPLRSAYDFVQAAAKNKLPKEALRDVQENAPYANELGPLLQLDPAAFAEAIFGSNEPSNSQYGSFQNR